MRSANSKGLIVRTGVQSTRRPTQALHKSSTEFLLPHIMSSATYLQPHTKRRASLNSDGRRRNTYVVVRLLSVAQAAGSDRQIVIGCLLLAVAQVSSGRPLPSVRFLHKRPPMSAVCLVTFRLYGVCSLWSLQVTLLFIEFVTAVHVDENHVRLNTRDINTTALTSDVTYNVRQ